MKRPRSIKVGNREYKVIVDPTLQLEDGCVGRGSHEMLEIRLLPRFHTSLLDEALLHETLHAIDNVYLDDKLHEEDIDALGQGLAQALQSMGIEFEWEKEAILEEQK